MSERRERAEKWEEKNSFEMRKMMMTSLFLIIMCRIHSFSIVHSKNIVEYNYILSLSLSLTLTVTTTENKNFIIFHNWQMNGNPFKEIATSLTPTSLLHSCLRCNIKYVCGCVCYSSNVHWNLKSIALNLGLSHEDIVGKT